MSEHARRGRHKVFLGMAAGVGNRYRALQELRAEYEAGRDAVSDTWSRPRTTTPRPGHAGYRDSGPAASRTRTWSSRNSTSRRCWRAGPRLPDRRAVAHQHARRRARQALRGRRRRLAAGIDVYSTVNVQHLESLNDPAAELPGARLRETLPDRVLLAADDVVIVDLTPPALIERLRELTIYRPERA